MQFSGPPGYGPVVPLQRDRHGGCALPRKGRCRFAAGLTGIYLTVHEILPAARHYPIAFIHSAERFLPVAVTGFETGRNLFVTADGDWRDGYYVPAYVRRYPFCVADVRRSEEGPLEHLICVDEAGLTAEGLPLFGEDGGGENGDWSEVQRLIDEMEGARPVTEAFTARLAEHGLLEPFQAHGQLRTGGTYRLSGLYRVAEARLNELGCAALKRAMREGHLSRIYAHLSSLDNFDRLLDLAAEHGQS